MRFTKKPVRYRKSIGEPSSPSTIENGCDVPSTSLITVATPEDIKEELCYGDDEVKSFFNVVEISDNEEPILEDETVDSEAIKNVVAQALLDYNPTTLEKRSVIVQRDTHKFWSLLLKQNFNLEKHQISVRFAGEAAADAGGPYREFLTLCMKHFHNVSTAVFGDQSELCFIGNAETIMSNVYYKLGQLVAVSILVLGRGPEALHPAIVRSMYNIPQPDIIEHVHDAALEHDVKKINEGSYDLLYDANINPSEKSPTELVRLFILHEVVIKRYAAINQFKEGLS